MANQNLLDKTFKVPSDVLKRIEVAKASTQDKNGLKRANFILKNGVLTYQAMKRLKNWLLKGRDQRALLASLLETDQILSLT